MGAILQQASRTTIAVSNPIAANTDTVLAWGSNTYDDMSCFPAGSTADIGMPAAGDYMSTAWCAFSDAAAGLRQMWFQIGSTTVARTSRRADPGQLHYIDLAMPWRTLGGETMNVIVRSAAAVTVASGALVITRVGSGPPGPQGIQGPQGIVGPTGAKGDKGDPGSATTGFATYADLL